MPNGIPILPPSRLFARKVAIDGEDLVIFEYPLGESAEPGRLEYTLTRSEAAVARLLLAGLSNAQIASSRGVAVTTVAKQVEKIFRRFGVHSRAEFAAHPDAAHFR